MKIQVLVLAALLVCSASNLAAEVKRTQVRGCHFGSSDGSDSMILVNRRVVYVTAAESKRIRFKKRVKRVACQDTDGDGFDEIVSYLRDGSTAVTRVKKSSKGNLSSVCKRVRNLLRGEIYKSIASDHINDQRAHSTSFITLRSTGAPRNNCLYVYDKAGNLIHKLGRYFPDGSAYSSRFYGGHGCGDGRSASSIASTARRNTGSSEGYITSGTKNCLRVPDLSRCYNSSAC